MATYLLPCSCGRGLEVDTGQAGRMVRCECGTELEVPSIRGLEQLKRTSAAVVTSTWGLRQAFLLVGLLMVILGLGAGVIYQVKRPDVDDLPAIRAQVEQWTTEQQRLYANYMHVFGIRFALPEDLQALDDDWRYSTYSKAGFLVGSIGLAITAAALLVPRRRAAVKKGPA